MSTAICNGESCEYQAFAPCRVPSLCPMPSAKPACCLLPAACCCVQTELSKGPRSVPFRSVPFRPHTHDKLDFDSADAHDEPRSRSMGLAFPMMSGHRPPQGSKSARATDHRKAANQQGPPTTHTHTLSLSLCVCVLCVSLSVCVCLSLSVCV